MWVMDAGRIWLFLTGVRVTEADSPAADAAAGSAPPPLPPAPAQSARCSEERGGPAGMTSHPGTKHTEQQLRICALFIEYM